MILHLNHITRQFSPATPAAVNAVSLSLAAGELLALLGPSGCGKTTLLRLIAGFEQPQSGTIDIADQQVAGGAWVPPEQRGVGMVFQDYALFPHLTVGQNIAFGLNASRKPSATVQQRIREVLALVGLDGLADRFPHQLSGGQQQRVALARALAPHPFLILLDEPLSNLDVQVRLRLRQELRSILKAAGTSAILVTHDQEEALSIADRVVVMRQGHIEQVGTPEELYQRPASRFVAEFVAQANLLPATRQADLYQTELGTFPQNMIGRDEVTSSQAPIDLADQQVDPVNQLDILVRQEEILLKPDEAGNAVITDRQFLGREYRYSIVLASGREVVARTPVTVKLAIGTKVRAIVTAETLQAFTD